MRPTTAAIICLLALGCATQYRNVDAQRDTAPQFERDHYECEIEAGAATAGAASFSVMAGAYEKAKLLNRCLALRGWRIAANR